MKTITYAAAFAILAATAACDDQYDQRTTYTTTTPQQQSSLPADARSTAPGGVPPSTIRQLRENVLTNQPSF